MTKQKVYLAGGFKSDWRKRIKKTTGFIWINPKEKEINRTMTPSEYGKWDLHYIRQADIVFVYVERDNTSCIGLSVEAGYAKGIGKTVILVLESNHETIKDSYLQIITQVSDVIFDNFEDGINYLKSFSI